ncbi:RalBP1-associated Eps domain-containing protein 2 [Acipenser ruthenus]|uniref:RalBP1-associated Eps domain-containing protein 2 n=1 Tax=Acipenser ruthenus TaxID=7906 RepID=A0A662YST3_ACIRT|nr:RalBP1-associated Eps domain-containing protein 2 [Acipenser ruthenus]
MRPFHRNTQYLRGAESKREVTELCGAKRLGYFGTGQFYVALKLLAAAQSGFPVRFESIKSEMPLPRFVGMKNDAEVLRSPNHSQNMESQGHQLGKPPMRIARPSLDRNSLKRTESLGDKQTPRSPPPSPLRSPPNSPSSSNYQDKALSYSYRKQWNSTEQLTASYESKHPSRPLLQQQVSSPSNYGSKSSLTHSSVTQALSVERSAEEGSADYHDDPWRITEEQQEYYTMQFKSLQPDLSLLISGSVAKNFFTKSKLSIPELSHIWELSDVDCDGALTLPEFCTAFHLIVARKNGYSLPDKLPQTLQPGFLQIDAAFSPKRNPVFKDTSVDEHTPLENTPAAKTGFRRGWLPPPALPPRPLAGQIPHFVSSTETTSQQKPVRKLNFADFSKFSEEEENAAKNEAQGQLGKAAGSSEESSPLKKDILPAQPPLKPIRRKYRPESQNLDSQEPTPPLPPPSSSAPGTKPHPPVQKQSSRQKRAIQTAIRKNKEANAVLARLNSELQQQLKPDNPL